MGGAAAGQHDAGSACQTNTGGAARRSARHGCRSLIWMCNQGVWFVSDQRQSTNNTMRANILCGKIAAEFVCLLALDVRCMLCHGQK